MDRERFNHLLEAYGADLKRWPAGERDAAAAIAAQDVSTASALEEARRLDHALDLASESDGDTSGLASRILAQAPRSQRRFDRRAMLALAACAVLGVILGYGGGRLAPERDVDDAYFSAAFEPPLWTGEEG